MTCRATRRERVLVVARRPSRTTAQTLADLLRGRPRARGDPARRRRRRRRHDRPRRPRAAARRHRPAGRRRHRRASRTSSGCSSRCREIGRAGPRRRRAVRRGHRAGLARRPRAARRVRRRHRRRRGPAARHRARSTAARTSGILASTDALVRQIPGRLVGHDDRPRRPARVRDDDARARAGHPPRQGGQQHLHQPGAAAPWPRRIYLATIGPHGLRDVAALGAARAAELEAALAAVGVAAAPSRAVPQRVRRPRARRAATVHRRLLERGVLAGLVLADAEPDDPTLADAPAGVRDRGHDDATRSPASRARSSEVLRGPAAGRRSRPAPATRPRRRRRSAPDERHRRPKLQPTLFERSRPGPRRRQDPAPAARTRSTGIPADARRATPPALPEMNEPEVVRHYVNLSQLNYAVDTGLLPARLVHDEVQPEAQRVGRPPAGLRRRSTRWPPTRSPRARSSCSGSSRGPWPRSPACAPSRSSRRPAPRAS